MVMLEKIPSGIILIDTKHNNFLTLLTILWFIEILRSLHLFVAKIGGTVVQSGFGTCFCSKSFPSTSSCPYLVTIFPTNASNLNLD